MSDEHPSRDGGLRSLQLYQRGFSRLDECMGAGSGGAEDGGRGDFAGMVLMLWGDGLAGYGSRS